MTPQPKDLWLVRVALGQSGDARPCIVLSVHEKNVQVLPLSSQMDLYRPANHFRLEKTDTDFPATGLLRTSYILGEKVIEVDVNLLTRRVGRLEGALAQDFDKWIN